MTLLQRPGRAGRFNLFDRVVIVRRIVVEECNSPTPAAIAISVT